MKDSSEEPKNGKLSVLINVLLDMGPILFILPYLYIIQSFFSIVLAALGVSLLYKLFNRQVNKSVEANLLQNSRVNIKKNELFQEVDALSEKLMPNMF